MKRRRPFQLLEILLAFLLVLIGIVPLIQSQVSLYKEQRMVATTNELDHTARLVAAQIIQRLYQQKISWDELWEETSRPYDPLHEEPWTYLPHLPYDITYTVKHLRSKPKDKEIPDPDKKNHLFQIELTFSPHQEKKKTQTYAFQTFVLKEKNGHA